MKIIGLEEHFATPEIMAAWLAISPELRDIAITQSQDRDIKRRLFNLADERVNLMDEAGIDVQVLSLATPGVQSLSTEQAIDMAFEINDLIAETVHRRADRFQGFATLPTPSPAKAARELERAVCKLCLNGAMIYGRTQNRNLDHPDFLPIFETAAALHAPLYLHPQSPVNSVRRAYYNGFGDKLDNLFASAGIGWHYETGIQALRLVMSGVFDRYPDLQLILGHWGEVVMFFLERIDMMSAGAKLQRPISAYFKRNISVTPSGFYSLRYLRWACEVLGPERILFSSDYPYALQQKISARMLLETAELNEQDRNNIANANWERMCANIRR